MLVCLDRPSPQMKGLDNLKAHTQRTQHLSRFAFVRPIMSQQSSLFSLTVSEQVLYATLTIPTHNEKVAMAMEIAIRIIQGEANSSTNADTGVDNNAEGMDGCVCY